MAASFQTLNFVADTGGATTTVSTSFQPKAIILMTHGKTSEGESDGASFSIGLSDGTNHRSVSWGGDNAVATTNVAKQVSVTVALMVFSNGSGTVPTGGQVTGVQFNSGNFVLTFNATPSAAWEISAIIFGGSDITNAFVGSDTALTSTGTKNVTGVGFEGDAVFLISAKVASAGITGGMHQMIGYATSSTKEWVLFSAIEDNQTDTPDSRNRFFGDACLGGFSLPTTVDYKASFLQWTADGFDLDFTNAAGAAYIFGYLVLKGGQWDGGTEAKPATATTQDFAVAFTPTGMGWVMSSPTALDTNTDNATTMIGAWDGTTEIYAGAYHNNAFNTVAKSSGASTKLLREMAATAEADGTTLAATTVITWTDAGTAYQVGWWAVGSEPSVDGTFGDFAGEFKTLRPAYW